MNTTVKFAVKVLRTPVLLVAGVAVAFPFVPPAQVVPADEAKVAPAKIAPGSPAAVLAKHADECWTGEEKPLTDGLPGAAVVQFNSGRTIYTTDAVLLDEAFAEALASIGHGDRISSRLDPIAMCL